MSKYSMAILISLLSIFSGFCFGQSGQLQGTNPAEYSIPDNGAYVSSPIVLSGAPAGAQITKVKVVYMIRHTYVGDLQVWLTSYYNGAWHDYYLWNRQGGSADDISETRDNLHTWDGALPNQTWYLCVKDCDPSEVGRIYLWGITVDYSVNVPKPDLIVKNISVSDSAVDPGQRITVSWTAKNEGDANCGSSYQGVMLSSNSTITDSDTRLAHEYLGSMDSGEISPESNSITIPDNVERGKTYYIGVIADCDNDITNESSESNNYGATPVAITINPLPNPDLIVQNISVSDNTVDPGQTITVYWTAKNQGTGSCGSSYQGVMFSSDNAINSLDTRLAHEYLGSMDSGETSPESNILAIPANAERGKTYYIGVIADCDNDITNESSETNNDDATPISIFINQLSETISPPTSITGDSATYVGRSRSYASSGASSNLGHTLQYQFDWGDGNLSGWGSSTQSHTWNADGDYSIKVRARCQIHTDIVSAWSGTLKAVSVLWVSLNEPSINPSGAGYVTKNPDKTEYAYGDVVTLTAHQNSGYGFSHWSGDVSGSSNSIQITIDTDTYQKNFTANFSVVSVTEIISLPTSITGDSTTYVGWSRSYTASGASSSLGHTLQYQFDWGDGNLSQWGNSTQSHVWNADGNFSVKFRARCQTHTDQVSAWSGTLKTVSVLWVSFNAPSVNPVGSGSVTKNPDKTEYAYGEVVTLTAHSNSGYVFSHWSGDVSGSSNSIQITMNTDTYQKNFTANFSSESNFIIGGAVYTQISEPLTSGLADVTVTASGANGTYTTVSSGSQGQWVIRDIPAGDYSITINKSGYTFQHVQSGVPASYSTVSITVNTENQSVNQSLQFLASASGLLFDMNWDGFVSIVGDVEPFIWVVYYNDFNRYQQQFTGEDYLFPADGNSDGFLSIVGDVQPFVNYVYFGTRSAKSSFAPSGVRLSSTDTFTIGGAIYSNINDPLTTGVENVTVASGDNIYTAVTSGSMGLWRIDNVPQGVYTITPNLDGYRFEHIIGGVSDNSSSATITVNSENSAVNQSIQFLAIELSTYRLDTQIASGQGSIILNPQGPEYAEGTTVTITASPADGYVFTSWAGDISAGSEQTNPLTITMDSSKSLTAAFTVSTVPPEDPDDESIYCTLGGIPLILMIALAGLWLIGLRLKFD